MSYSEELQLFTNNARVRIGFGCGCEMSKRHMMSDVLYEWCNGYVCGRCFNGLASGALCEECWDAAYKGAMCPQLTGGMMNRLEELWAAENGRWKVVVDRAFSDDILPLYLESQG